MSNPILCVIKNCIQVQVNERVRFYMQTRIEEHHKDPKSQSFKHQAQRQEQITSEIVLTDGDVISLRLKEVPTMSTALLKQNATT